MKICWLIIKSYSGEIKTGGPEHLQGIVNQLELDNPNILTILLQRIFLVVKEGFSNGPNVC